MHTTFAPGQRDKGIIAILQRIRILRQAPIYSADGNDLIEYVVLVSDSLSSIECRASLIIQNTLQQLILL